MYLMPLLYCTRERKKLYDMDVCIYIYLDRTRGLVVVVVGGYTQKERDQQFSEAGDNSSGARDVYII